MLVLSSTISPLRIIMLYFSFTKRCATTVLLFLCSVVFFSVNAQKKLPTSPFVTNLAGCPNPIIGCSLFVNPQNYTCASTFTYVAATNDNECLTGPSGANYGCLGTVRNQMWFVITAQTTGTLTFSYNNSNFRDVDGAIWGAISNNDLANACSSTLNAPISCDYSSSDIISLSINAVAGQKYVMMIANYSNSGTNINIRQPSGGTVSYCKVNASTCVAPTVTVSGNSTINQGQSANISLAFTGAAPYNYTLSDGQTGTTSTNPLTISVSPLSTTTYSVTSLSNACGAGTSSGSGVVTVSRTVQLVSCFPFNNNVMDQIGSNNGVVNVNGGSSSFVTNRNSTATSALSIANGAYVEFPTTNLLNNTFTNSLWVSPTNLPTNGNFSYILSIGGIGQSQELYLENDAGVVKWVFRSSTTSGNVDVKYPANITLGQWYHVAIVRTTNALQMYVNGILVQSSPASGLSSTYASSSIGRLGTQSSGLVNFFSGKIDDVRLFKGGLNGLEISSLYNSTLDCPPIVGVPLISVTNITNSTLCRNQLETVNFQQSEVTAGSTYTVQLSNSSGSFTTPIVIGTGTLPPIQVSIPTTVTTSGSGYLIRIINGTTVSFNTLPITILPTATGIITGTASIDEGQSTNLTINFTGTSPWTYSIFNGVSSTSYSSTTSTAVQSVSPLATTTYTLSSVKDNTCGTGTGSGSAVITVSPVLQLLACYKFDGNAQDSKGLHHGTVNGATLTTDRFGRANSAYNFNGTSNYIQLSNQNDFGVSKFVWSAWVNASELPAFGDARTILSVGNDAGDQHLMLLNSNLTSGSGWNYGSYTSNTTVALPYALSYSSVLSNNWIHLVVVRTLTDRKIYVNGQLSVSYTAISPIPPYYSAPISATVGSRYNATQTFKGKIDDIKIYKGTLTDEEVLLLYNEEQGECSSPCSGMIYSLSSGNWNVPATWSCGRVPDFTDNVLIKAGHTVTVSTNDARAKKLLDNGRVTFANSTSKLSFGNTATQNLVYEIQPNATVGKDALVSSYLSNGNHETINYMGPYAGTQGGTNNINRTFIAFDLSTIPTNAIVDSAYLTIFYSQAIVDILYPTSTYFDGHVGDTRLWMQKVTQNWSENTITWNNQPSTSITNQVSIPLHTSKTQNYKLNVKTFVQDMVTSPSSNYGFMLKLQNETPYTLVALASSDEVNPNNRPKLQVYYRLP